jgi:aldehyde:ferredoxin oxidoreductase
VENVISFWTGPFAGTVIPATSKYTAVGLSALTGAIGFGLSSGYWGNELKRAGWDGIVFRGRAASPCYLFVDDDVVELRDATHLWGKTTWQTEDAIKEELRDSSVRVASIGPAGERLVKFALITNARNRHVARCGMGTIMGSKRLKAVAVRGTGDVQVHDLKRLLRYCKPLYKLCRAPFMYYGTYGTPIKVLQHQKTWRLATNNFQQMTFKHAEQVSGERMLETRVEKVIGCDMCAIACDHVTRVKRGKYKGAVASIDFETLWALGPCCGVGNFNPIIKATQLCDELGVDTISAGVTIAWAMEAYEKGILTRRDVDGLNLRFGNGDALVEAVRRLCLREGRLGKLLAEGCRAAALRVGKGSIRFAMQIKGLETSAYPFRTMQTGALGHATCITGAFYQRSGSYSYDEKDVFDRFSLTPAIERAQVVVKGENLYTVIDSLILCKFSRRIYKSNRQYVKLYNLVTGLDMTLRELIRAGERVYTLGRCFNVRMGLSRADDYLPARAYEEPVVRDAAGRTAVVDRRQFDEALSAYYRLRGWNEQGVPTRAKLCALGLHDAAREVGV